MTPPRNKAAEWALLSAIRLNPSILLEVDNQVRPEWFGEVERIVYSALVELGPEAESLIAVKAALQASTLTDSSEPICRLGGGVAIPRLWPTYVRLILESFVQRAAIDALKAGIETIAAASGDTIPSALDEAETALSTALAPLRQASKGQPFDRTGFREILEMLDAPTGRDMLIPTGWAALDNLAEIPVGLLTVVGARPRIGKTSLFLSLARHLAAQGKRVAYIVAEDTPTALKLKLVTQETGIPFTRVAQLVAHGAGNPDDARDLDLIRTAVRDLDTLPIQWEDAAPVEVLRMRVRELHRRERLDVVFVDHALDLPKPRGYREMRDKISAIVEAFRSLAIETGVAVVLATQLHRHKARPSLDNLKETGKFEEAARLLWLLDREDPDDPEPQPLWVHVAKATTAATGMTALCFEPRRMRVRPFEPGELDEWRLRQKADRDVRSRSFPEPMSHWTD